MYKITLQSQPLGLLVFSKIFEKVILKRQEHIIGILIDLSRASDTIGRSILFYYLNWSDRRSPICQHVQL